MLLRFLFNPMVVILFQCIPPEDAAAPLRSVGLVPPTTSPVLTERGGGGGMDGGGSFNGPPPANDNGLLDPRSPAADPRRCCCTLPWPATGGEGEGEKLHEGDVGRPGAEGMGRAALPTRGGCDCGAAVMGRVALPT